MSKRGFSLIEVMVALVVGAILASAATAVLITARRSVVESAARSQLAREGQLVIDLLERDLRHVGAGVPLGTNADTAAAANQSLLPIIRRGSPKNLVFLGDQPYPNSEFPGISSVTRINGQLVSDLVAITNEVSGACTPPAVGAPIGFQCRTGQRTLVPQAIAYDAADDCTSAQPNARTCPWSMNKWQPGAASEFLTFAAGDGSWFERKVSASGLGASFEEYAGVDLDDNFPSFNGQGLDAARFLTSGYVASIDRVFWAIEGPAGAACTNVDCTVFRRQCWGQLQNPGDADFPATGTGFYGTGANPINCTPGTTGTDWEPVAKVATFSFTYYQNTAALSATLGSNAERSQVRAIEVDFTLTKAMNTGRVLTERVKRRIFINNRETP